MKAIVGTALLGLAFGAQDDELWSLFPKAATPDVTEPLPVIENTQNSGNNAIKLTPPASYSGGSYLFKKSNVLTLDDDNDELWSLFPKAATPDVTEPLPVIENTQNSGNNAIKLTPPASYTGGSYLFKKSNVLTLDDDNDELWSLFPKAEPPAPPTADPSIIDRNRNDGNKAIKVTPPGGYTGGSYLFKKADVLTLDDENDELWSLFPKATTPDVTEPLPVIENTQNSGNNAIKLTPPASYTGGSYLFKKSNVLTLDDDDEFFSQSKVADSHRESKFFGNLGRFVTKNLQPRETVKRPVQVQIQADDDELVNLNALLNDAVKTYNDARQSKPNVGQLVNDGIQIIRDIKKHDDEDNELFELAQLLNEVKSAQNEVKKAQTKAKNFLRHAKQAKRTVEDTLCFEIHGVRHCLAHPEN